MKKLVSSLLLGVSVWLLFPVLATEAQSFKVMKVQVPFDFQIRDRQYPAGTYTVSRQGAFLTLRNHSGKTLNVLTANALVRPTASPDSKLVFFEYNGAHLLTQVLWEGDTYGSEFVRPEMEVNVARRIVPAAKVASAQVGGR
jgi:hypothetical protein